MHKTFGEYVMREREQRGYSAGQLGKRVGVATATITRIESGFIAVPTPEVLIALVDALELDMITAVMLVEPYRRLYERILTAVEADRGSQ
jgi:transcriptional regulator with XRE-family HTH domain